MSILKNSLVLCLLAFSLALALPLQAQNEKTNVKKDLMKVLKELPPEMQMQVLSYAERKRDALAATEKNLGSTATIAAEAQAAPAQPEQAKAITVQQPSQPAAISLSPQATGTATPVAAPATPAPPAQPDYMEKAATLAQTSIEWESLEYDYGTVKTGEVVKHTFRFKNTGDNPLVLTRVKASCGCTTPKYSTDAIPPGGEGFIDIAFDTAGKTGIQRKSVTVTANVQPNNIALRINGEVAAAAQ